MRRTLCSLVWLCSVAASAQSIGTVQKNDADISGTLQTNGDAIVILTSGVVASKGRPTEVKLTRGGTVRVCQLSSASLAQSTSAKSPMLLALNRGAFEVRMNALATDAVLTPDLRIDLSNSAPLDLRVRVASNGDTCVENRGKDAPALHVTSQFVAGGYFVNAGQHVLFEHGSVQEVVDRESSACGCPASQTVLAGNSKDPNPFPEAVSQGLEEPKVPQAAPGQTHTQVTATLAYNGAAGAAPDANPSAAPQEQVAPPVSAPTPQQGGNPFRSIGHFFRRIFGGS